MAVKKHGVHFDVTAENATDRALQAVEHNLGRVNKAADAVGRTLQSAFIATAAISMGKAFANAAIEAEGAQKRLNAVLKATGGVAGATAKDVHDLADAMAASTQFDDETLRNGAAQLVKFGTVHGEVFRGAMAISADLAAFMGSDFTSAIQAVGKALHSPQEGLTALERQIGKIDPATKRWIETLVDQGRTAEAQGRVLEVLRGRVGGVASEMNTGLFKATTDVGKAWDEMLEAFAKTPAYQNSASASLSLLEKSLRNIKDLVEDGGWIKEYRQFLADTGGVLKPGQTQAQAMAEWRERMQGPPRPAAVQERKGAIIGAAGAMSLDAELAGAPMSDADIKAHKEYLKLREEAAEKAKKAIEEWKREAQRGAEQQLTWEEMAATDKLEAWEFYMKGRLEQEERIRKETREKTEAASRSWVESAEIATEAAESVVYTWDAAGNRIELARDAWEEAAHEAKRADDAARDLGLTFSSAFEDAVLEGKKLSDVLRGLGKDVGRIFLRETVTRPLADAAAGIFKGFDIGSFLGFRAEGGPVSAWQPYIVGERGPEMIVPRTSGTVVPNHALAGGGAAGVTIINNIYPDLRGAPQEAVEALHRMVVDLKANVPAMALGAYTQARTRGRL